MTAEVNINALVSDTETAMTENGFNAVFAVEDMARRQGEGVVGDGHGGLWVVGGAIIAWVGGFVRRGLRYISRTNENEPQKLMIRNSAAELLIFTRQLGGGGIEVRCQDESVWLTQRLMAELFDVDVRTVSGHLINIFENNELIADSVIRNYRITAADGKNHRTRFYNLDAIISVGYRVNFKRATQFRQWATGVLREFTVKGCAPLIAEVDKLQRLAEVLRFEHGDNRLQFVAFFAGDADLVALNHRLRLELVLLDALGDFFA